MDLTQALTEEIQVNESKYPVEKAPGASRTKYTESEVCVFATVAIRPIRALGDM